MNENKDKLRHIIHFQRRYRFIKSEIDSMNSRLEFLRNIFFNVVSNFDNLNNINFFNNLKEGKNTCCNVLDEIKKHLTLSALFLA